MVAPCIENGADVVQAQAEAFDVMSVLIRHAMEPPKDPFTVRPDPDATVRDVQLNPTAARQQVQLDVQHRGLSPCNDGVVQQVAEHPIEVARLPER